MIYDAVSSAQAATTSFHGSCAQIQGFANQDFVKHYSSQNPEVVNSAEGQERKGQEYVNVQMQRNNRLHILGC